MRVFLEEFGAWIHALELNGLQPAASNVDTIHLAAERGLPVISGGDRHCCEPNANVNLTNAGTFAAFVNEIRCEKRSCVLFLPQYRDPIPVDGSGVLYARDRRDRDARVRVAHGEPAVIRAFIATIALLASPGMRAMLCSTMGRVGNLEVEVP